jgi:hypothetical protein
MAELRVVLAEVEEVVVVVVSVSALVLSDSVTGLAGLLERKWDWDCDAASELADCCVDAESDWDLDAEVEDMVGSASKSACDALAD